MGYNIRAACHKTGAHFSKRMLIVPRRSPSVVWAKIFSRPAPPRARPGAADKRRPDGRAPPQRDLVAVTMRAPPAGFARTRSQRGSHLASAPPLPPHAGMTVGRATEQAPACAATIPPHPLAGRCAGSGRVARRWAVGGPPRRATAATAATGRPPHAATSRARQWPRGAPCGRAAPGGGRARVAGTATLHRQAGVGGSGGVGGAPARPCTGQTRPSVTPPQERRFVMTDAPVAWRPAARHA